jgi:hypothetical protein
MLMKRIFFLAFTIWALVLTSAPRADAAEVSIDFFYDNLGSDDGSWIEVADYGYCWQPNVAASNSDWRPYSDGYWAYTDVGWTWVSYEDFGWATYHYGRWARLADQGWVWVPGYEWGPAWVSWRTGGDQVGWAPLPPRYRGSGGGGEVVYEGRPITGQVDIEFDIGPAYYNFVDVRYIGAPILREHIYAPSQNVTYISRTVNVTNITYNNSVAYNHGPDYDQMNRYSTRPIQRLSLQRERNFDAGVVRQRGDFTKVQGNNLVIAAPQTLQRRSERLTPKNVKRKIEKPDFQTGWTGLTDAKAKAELQEKMKKEDRKAVPPPSTAPVSAASLAAAASPGATVAASPASATTPGAGSTPPAAVTASPATAASPAAGSSPPVMQVSPAPDATGDQGRDRNKRVRGSIPQQTPAGTPAAGASPAATGASPAPAASPADRALERGRGRDKRDRTEEKPQPNTAPAGNPPETVVPGATGPTAPSTASPAGAPEKGRPLRKRDPLQQGVPRTVPPTDSEGVTEPGNQRPERNLDAPPAPSGDAPIPAARGKRSERLNAPPAVEEAPPARPSVKPEGQVAPRGIPPQAAPPPRQDIQVPPPSQAVPPKAPSDVRVAPAEGQGKREKGDKKKGDEAPASPAPQ